MKTDLKKSIAHEIIGLIPKLIPIGLGEHIIRSENAYLLNMAFYFEASSSREYYSLLSRFLDVEPFASKISANLLTKLFDELVAEYMSKPHSVDDVCVLIDALEQKASARVEKWHYYLCVEGIVLSSLEIQFGSHLLFQLDSERREMLLGQFFGIIDQMPVNDEMKKYHRGSVKSNFENAEGLLNKACLKLEIEGDQSFIKENAPAVASPILHILTFVIHGYMWSTQKCKIGFGSGFGERLQLIPMVNDTMTKCSISGERIPDHQIQVIDALVASKLNEHGFDSLIAIYTKPPVTRSEVEKMLLRAIQFFYNGYTALDRISEFINYMMVLENFLSPSDQIQLTKTIAEGTAILLEKEVDERIRLNDFVKKLYKVRSSLVHGKSDEVELAYVRSARVLSHRLIQAVVANRTTWIKQEDILEKVDRIKFGGSLQTGSQSSPAN